MKRDQATTLNGWKEISSHLRVTVRTAQLWEKQRGLPIHRYPGDGKPRVYAYPEELEAWLEDSPSDLEETPVPVAKRAAWPRLAWIAIAIVALGSAAWIWTATPVERRRPVRCALSDKVLQAFDPEDEVIWQEAFPDIKSGLLDTSDGQRCLVLDADGDGWPEVYLQFMGEDRLKAGGKLVRLEDNGSIRWERPYGRPLEIEGRRFARTFLGTHLHPVQIDGRSLLLAAAAHSPHYPAEAALIDPLSGATVETYYHPGNFYGLSVGDIDGDGDDELLLAAINNPGPGPGHPALVVLDLPFSGPDGTRRLREDFFGNPGPKELAYYVLPRADVDDAIGVQSRVSEVGVPDDGPLTLTVLSSQGQLTYSLDVANLLQPKVTNVVAETTFRLAHDHLADEGLIDHRLGDLLPARYYQVLVYETAPNGNAPEVATALGQVSSIDAPTSD
jgi:hypothetical protein